MTTLDLPDPDELVPSGSVNLSHLRPEDLADLLIGLEPTLRGIEGAIRNADREGIAAEQRSANLASAARIAGMATRIIGLLA